MFHLYRIIPVQASGEWHGQSSRSRRWSASHMQMWSSVFPSPAPDIGRLASLGDDKLLPYFLHTMEKWGLRYAITSIKQLGSEKNRVGRTCSKTLPFFLKFDARNFCLSFVVDLRERFAGRIPWRVVLVVFTCRVHHELTLEIAAYGFTLLVEHSQQTSIIRALEVQFIVTAWSFTGALLVEHLLMSKLHGRNMERLKLGWLQYASMTRWIMHPLSWGWCQRPRPATWIHIVENLHFLGTRRNVKMDPHWVSRHWLNRSMRTKHFSNQKWSNIWIVYNYTCSIMFMYYWNSIYFIFSMKQGRS